jgi:O-antigen/teichoic acid export membrane protein/GT2 family glycosyltransferase
MSLTDKVIKNTYYNYVGQAIGFIFPLFLTPFIVTTIGEVQFGIYALVLGFSGTFTLLDLSISSSFIKFISEDYNKKNYEQLNHTISTGLIFYLIFSTIVCVGGFIFARPLVGLLNIPPHLQEISLFAFHISIVIFFITNVFGIFNSVLVSLQKMYITNVYGIIITVLNTTAIIILLLNGFGLAGLLISQLVAVSLSIIVSYIAAKRVLPEMSIRPKYFSRFSLKRMTGFGIQMQVSKLASFASDKYDEFLLGFFSVMSNVAFFNIGARIARIGRFVPYQLVPQVAPVAAELNAREDKAKLVKLFEDTTKYLTVVSIPIFIFIFAFADIIIYSWMGPGFEVSIYILRILAIGQLINMIFSAPGNSITPNIGIPKYQMHEGLINLGLNLVISYILIKNYGIIGAAVGNTISISLSSIYIFYVSSRHFKKNMFEFLRIQYGKPFLVSAIGAGLLFGLFYASSLSYPVTGRVSGIIYLVTISTLYFLIFTVTIFNLNYFTSSDKVVLAKFISKIFFLEPIFGRIRKNRLKPKKEKYDSEKVSLFIVTHNRIGMIQKCVSALIPTLKDVNYELIIWDNGSTDGTAEYLKSIQDIENVKIILHDENIGINAKGRAAELCKGAYITGIDDDVTFFPDNWIQEMVKAYKTIPKMGYLSTNVVRDETTNGAKPPEDMYFTQNYESGKIKLQIGPVGGWCFMISREVYNKVGKFQQIDNRIFFNEDGNYVYRTLRKGYKCGILEDVRVYHATGEFHNKEFQKVYDDKMMDYKKSAHGKENITGKIKKLFQVRFFLQKTSQFFERELSKNN